MQRRTWLQGWMLGTAQALTGLAWSRLLVSEVQAVQTGPGALYLAIEDYPALQVHGGSMMISLGEVDAPLIVTRASEEVFHALDSTCTHAGCLVGVYSAANGYMQCPCHGSRFNIRGQVVRGPADQNLATYTVGYQASAGELKIQMPSLPMDARPVQILRRGSSLRLRLTVHVEASQRYQLHYRRDPEAAFIAVPFAVQAHAIADVTELTATSDGTRHLYVDTQGKRGFYQWIEME